MSSPATCRPSPGSRRGDGACGRCPAAPRPRRPLAGGQGAGRLRPLGTGAGAACERHRGRGAAALRRRAHGRGARRRARGPFRRRPRAHRRRGRGAADGSRRKAHGGAVTIAPPPLAPPLGLLAELTHRCPLACPYCSNPLELERRSGELDTATWMRVFDEAAALGVLQLHLSGGEPASRSDLVELVRGAARAGLYTNLITSGIGLDERRLATLAETGLDHIQLSVQHVNAAEADRIAGFAGAHAKKRALARGLARIGVPLNMNAVIHRANIDAVEALVREAVSLGARRIEVAHSQYYGWALKNRAALRRSGRRSPKYRTVSSRNRPLTGAADRTACPAPRAPFRGTRPPPRVTTGPDS